MHAQALAFIAATPFGTGRVLEFGSRNINGSARDLFLSADWTGVDVVDGNGVEVVADAATVELADRFGMVVCAEVFEHADDETCAAMCANAYRHLVSGGMFVATMAGPGRLPHSAVDGGHVRDGEFYRNVEADQLRVWLWNAGFDVVDIDEIPGDLRVRATK
jgi:hypothetical protein